MLPPRKVVFALALGHALTAPGGLASAGDAGAPLPWATPGSAEDPEARAGALLLLGEAAEQRSSLEEAYALYMKASEASPRGPNGARARARIAWLDARTGEGSAELVRLESVRSDPGRAADPEVVLELARDAEGFHQALTRTEALLFAAEALTGRLGRETDGLRAYRAVARDPSSGADARRLAASRLVAWHGARREVAGARAALTLLGPLADASLESAVLRLERRRAARRTALASLGLLGLGLATTLARSWRRGALGSARGPLRRSLGLALAFGGHVAIVGSGLAWYLSRASPAPILGLGAALVLLLVCARAWAALGSGAPLFRSARALVAAASVLGAGFLVLEWADPRYLESFGL